MTIKINFKSSNTIYKNNCLHLVKGWFEHTCLGNNNDLHNKYSNYSMSPMLGYTRCKRGEQFPNGGYIIFSTPSSELMEKVVMSLFNGSGTKVGDMQYNNFEFINDAHIHSDYDIVRTVSPILLKHDDKKITCNDDNFIAMLTDQCKKKLVANGIEPNKAKTLKLEMFHPENSAVVDMQYNNVHNFASKIMLIVKGNAEARKTLYDLGIGNSTGCGFGTVSVNK